MRQIKKNAEPPEWRAYRLTPGVSYQAIRELRESLLKEQGYICAYCMRRIPLKDSKSNETSRIEHILSRENHPDRQLNYTNMAICCPGAIDNHVHCDNSKGSKDITFDLYNRYLFTTLSYKAKDGEIISSDANFNTQMNDILNLNHPLLKAGRNAVRKGIFEALNKQGWTEENIKRQIELWDNKDDKGCYRPYCGMVVWYLTKKLNQTKK